MVVHLETHTQKGLRMRIRVLREEEEEVGGALREARHTENGGWRVEGSSHFSKCRPLPILKKNAAHFF